MVVWNHPQQSGRRWDEGRSQRNRAGQRLSALQRQQRRNEAGLLEQIPPFLLSTDALLSLVSLTAELCPVQTPKTTYTSLGNPRTFHWTKPIGSSHYQQRVAGMELFLQPACCINRKQRKEPLVLLLRKVVQSRSDWPVAASALTSSPQNLALVILATVPPFFPWRLPISSGVIIFKKDQWRFKLKLPVIWLPPALSDGLIFLCIVEVDLDGEQNATKMYHWKKY